MVFIVARDWPLRALLRAELRQRGIEALGMQTAAEVGTRIASGMVPSAVVLEAAEELEPGLELLARRLPVVVVASASNRDVWPKKAAVVLRKPLRIGEVAGAVIQLLGGVRA